jgi:hypothetical protein
MTATNTTGGKVYKRSKDYKRLYDENRELFIIACMLGATILINRAILRREIVRINFSADFFPYEDVDLIQANLD